MSSVDRRESSDGTGVYFYLDTSLVGQYVRALNRNGYNALRVIRTRRVPYDEGMFFLTAQEAEDWIIEPLALRRLRGQHT